MLAPGRASWQNPRILALLFLIFLCGALAGAITVSTGLHQRLHRNSSNAAFWRDSKDAQFSYDTLKRELNLTPEQSDRLKTILDDFVKYHDDLEAQIDDVRATGRNRIVQMLTPDQRARFEKMSQQLSSR